MPLHRRRFLSLCLLSLGSWFALSPGVAAPPRIMPVGDSLTQTSPGYRGPLLAALKAAGHDVVFIGPRSDADSAHAGFGGFTIGPGPSKADDWSDGKGSIHAQLDDVLAGEKPDLILLLVGVNDFFNIKRDLDPDYDVSRDGPARLAGVLDKIHALSPKTRVLYSSLLPVAWDRNFAADFNRQLPALAKTRPYAIFADLNAAAGLAEGDWQPDKLHLTASGYAKLARAWAGALEPVLKAR